MTGVQTCALPIYDFGWDHAVLRADIESGRLAETVEGCVMLAVERAMRTIADAMEDEA